MAKHLVFVYGTLKRGFGNHRLLKTSRFIGVDTIDGMLYDLGPFPALSLNAYGNGVHGEIYEVNDKVLQQLDWLEGVPTLYNRSRVKTHGGTEVNTYVFVGHLHDSKYLPEGVWPVTK